MSNRYRIDVAETPERLARYAEEAISEGWEPLGAPFVWANDQLCQALVRPEPKESAQKYPNFSDKLLKKQDPENRETLTAREAVDLGIVDKGAYTDEELENPSKSAFED